MLFPKKLLCWFAILLGCSANAKNSASEVALAASGPAGPLEGTLRLAQTRGIATVLIIPGSGPTDRDGNSPLGLKASTYKLLAEGLAGEGVTSLRFDKRGMFASAAATPDANDVTIEDYVQDVKSWVSVLRQRTQAPCVWLMGHSEGGLVALAAASDPGVCGLILISTAGRTMGEVLREQIRSNPANEPIVAEAERAIDTLEQGHRVDTDGMHAALQRLFNPAVQRFMISAFSYDPRRLIGGIDKPVLILQGKRDLQVGEPDARLLQQADPQASLVLMDGVNHVLKFVGSADAADNIATYRNPDLPLAPGVLDSIAQFLASHPGSEKR